MAGARGRPRLACRRGATALVLVPLAVLAAQFLHLLLLVVAEIVPNVLIDVLPPGRMMLQVFLTPVLSSR